MTAMQALNILRTVLMILTTLCYCYQLVYLFLPLLRKSRRFRAKQTRRYAVLIAARNEEAVLPHLLDSLRAQDYPAPLIRTFVVADNCTDRTAEVARQHGATVFTRFNREQVGKGYALNYLIEQLRSEIGLEQYDAFLVFDADNLLSADYISKLDSLPSNGYDVFCGYRNSKNFGTNWLTSGYAIWYLHESTHMNRSRMGNRTGCAVSGTGFGFTREILDRLGGWNFFTLTEDIEFNSWCAVNGIRIGYCHDAVLYDEQPFEWGQSFRQRVRWVQGGIQVSFKYGSRLLKGFFRGNWQSWTCFELMTLSLWGYAFAAVAGCFNFLLSVFTQPLTATLLLLVTLLAGAYLSMGFMGALTVAMEWKRIYGTAKEKLLGILTFPLFLASFAPIALAAFFRKCEWAPIRHTVAISNDQLQK